MTATPELLAPVLKNYTVIDSQIVHIAAVAKDTSAATIDVSSGYTAKLLVQPATSPSPHITDLIADASVSASFDSGGNVTVDILPSLYRGVFLPSSTFNYSLLISHDSFSTRGLVQQGTITITPGKANLP